MKEKDSRVDNAHQLVLYVEKDDQSYGPVQTGSFMVENYLSDFLEKKSKLQQNRLQSLREGLISPLAYYKDLVEIGEGDLACRVGISRRKLRRHMTPQGFSGASVDHLKRYAVVFGVPVAQLFQVILCEHKEIVLKNEQTALPEVIISHITLQSPKNLDPLHP